MTEMKGKAEVKKIATDLKSAKWAIVDAGKRLK
jgi:hypothetical protein